MDYADYSDNQPEEFPADHADSAPAHKAYQYNYNPDTQTWVPDTGSIAGGTRQSIIAIFDGLAATDYVLGAQPSLASILGSDVVNIKNLGTADVLFFTGNDANVSYPLESKAAIAGDFNLNDLKVRSTAAVKLAVWGGKDQ